MANNDIATLIERYPWWSEGHIALAREHEGQSRGLDESKSAGESRGQSAGESRGALPHASALVAMLHPTALIPRRQIDAARLTYLSHDDLIERFLKREEYRIVAEEGTADDLAIVNCDPEEEMVSEDLAEIYAKQGLYDEAIDIYRKLSLLNSEKSIYFAGLIATIEQKKDKN